MKQLAMSTKVFNVLSDNYFHSREDIMVAAGMNNKNQFTACLAHLRKKKGLRLKYVKQEVTGIIMEVKVMTEDDIKEENTLPCFVDINVMRVCRGMGCYHKIYCPAVKIYQQKRGL